MKTQLDYDFDLPEQELDTPEEELAQENGFDYDEAWEDDYPEYFDEEDEEVIDESLTEDTHAKYAKPEGDRIGAFNNALKYAKKENKPFIYGYTNSDEKFFALDQPIKCTDINTQTKEFKNKYKNCNVVYVAYPDKDFINENLKEDKKDDELPVDPEAAKLKVHTMLNDLVADEIEAINGYDDAKAQIIDTPIEHKDSILDTIDHIKGEEQEHIDELIDDATEILFDKEYPDKDLINKSLDEDIEDFGDSELESQLAELNHYATHPEPLNMDLLDSVLESMNESINEEIEPAIGTSKAYEMYLQRLERFKNDKEALEYDLKDLMRTKVLPKDEVEDLINKYKYRISKLQESINESKLEKVPSELFEDVKLNWDTIKELKSDIYHAMKGYWQTVFSDEWFDENAFSLEQDNFDEKILILKFKIRKEAYFRTEPDFEKFKEILKIIPGLKLKKIHKKLVKIPFYDNDKFIQVDEITFQYIGQITESVTVNKADNKLINEEENQKPEWERKKQRTLEYYNTIKEWAGNDALNRTSCRFNVGVDQLKEWIEGENKND